MPICEIELTDLEDLIGRDLDARYILEEFIDRGSYGAVYRATDRKFNQPVAIKVGFSSREFMKEARLAAEVKHNHIVQVSDFGCDNGLAYLVMEYLVGEDLEKLFEKQGRRLASDQLRKFVDEIGDALAQAHSDHLIHRDLKPRNIILTGHVTKSGTSKSRFVLLDFGIAAKLDSQGTQRNRTQDGAGTVEYMAPELLTKNPKATQSSDIYAFGVVLYQMMTGQVPFPQEDSSHLALVKCLSAISNDAAPRFSQVAPGGNYPAAMEELVMQCLEKDPSRRPESMMEVRERFLQIDEPFSQTSNGTLSRREIRQETVRVTSGSSPKQTIPLPEPIRSVSVQFDPGTLSRQRWWIAGVLALVVAVGAAGLGAYYLANRHESAYAVLTFEHGHVYGKCVDDKTPLTLETNSNVRLSFVIEGSPDDVVHFEQPSAPDGMLIETLNGPVPNKSKVFVLTWDSQEVIPTKELTFSLRAKCSSRSEPFEKSVRISVVAPKS